MDFKEIFDNNNIILSLYSDYLNNDPTYISKEEVRDFAKEFDLDYPDAFYFLLAAIFGFDNETDKDFLVNYLRPSINMLDLDSYINNEYARTVLPKEGKVGSWQIKYQTYKPFEAFVCNDFKVYASGKTLPQVGFFKNKYKYISVLEEGREWMLLTPNEIETMKLPIDNAKGSVLTLGLGLGYFAFMTSLKDDVTKITVIEKDKNIIELFKKCLLPFFKYQDKIEIIEADAFDYIKGDLSSYDYIFADLWHDAGDGLDMYHKLRETLDDINIKVDYWIEKTLLVYDLWFAYVHEEIGPKELETLFNGEDTELDSDALINGIKKFISKK